MRHCKFVLRWEWILYFVFNNSDNITYTHSFRQVYFLHFVPHFMQLTFFHLCFFLYKCTAAKHTAPAASTRKTISAYIFTYPAACSHAAPTAAPVPTRRMFHSVLPIIVNSRNFGISIRAIPAGTEMRLRMIGMHRPNRTARWPFFWNHVISIFVH